MISTTVSPGFGSRSIPQNFSNRADAGIADRRILGVNHRNQADVRRALHVVLPAQRVQPRPGMADVAAQQGQRDQATRVVGAVDVLRDPHAPENQRCFRVGI